ncbi:MAG: hypothetical protein RIQ53_1214 [Pseudomonadota bacterium]|jgi:hypothetical protein
MSTRILATVALLCGALSLPVWAGDSSPAGQAVRESGRASVHGSTAVALALAATGQVVFAVSAVPLSVGATVSGAVATGSQALARESARPLGPIGTPLLITPRTLSNTVAPDQALRTPVVSR